MTFVKLLVKCDNQAVIVKGNARSKYLDSPNAEGARTKARALAVRSRSV